MDAAKIPAFMKFANTVRTHWPGIVHFVESRITTGILEGINSKIQLAKRRASDYRNINNFINMIYFLCEKLKFDYPPVFHIEPNKSSIPEHTMIYWTLLMPKEWQAPDFEKSLKKL